MKRSHLVLGVVLVAQILLILLVRGPLSGTGARGEAGTLLPELESVTVGKVEITDGDGKSVTLERDGDAWLLPALGGYPADGAKVADVLAKLREVDGRRPVVSSGRHHAALKVADGDFERRVRMWGDTDGKPVELYIGSSPNYQVSNVRRGGADRVYEGQGVSAFDLPATPEGWIDRKLVDAEAEGVSRIELQNRRGRFALEKREGHWSVVEPSSRSSRALDQTKVETFVRMVAPLYVSEAAGARTTGQGLDSPIATVTLHLGPHPDEATALGAAPARVVTIYVGAEKPDGAGMRYAGLDGANVTAVIVKATADKLADQSLDDLLL